MDANELRIGNLVIFGDDEQATAIEWQDIRWVSNDEKDFNDAYSPIPLTEEWLAKFGWYNSFSACSMYKDEEYKHQISIKNGIYEYSTGNNFIKILYVHQLQNLYFALTGQELTIKETATG